MRDWVSDRNHIESKESTVNKQGEGLISFQILKIVEVKHKKETNI